MIATLTEEQRQERAQRRKWAESLRPGDFVRPDPTWNSTEPQRNRKLPDKVEILDLRPARWCQTGVMLEVESLTGNVLHLSAGWFLPLE